VNPDVSILILTRNGSATLPAVLEGLADQRSDWTVETLAIDSGSTDSTLAVLKRFGVCTHSIAPRDFDHGLTRNFGIQQTRGRFIVLLVQDAVPASSEWLARLVAPLVQDQQIAGSYARQIARPDASTLTRFYLDQWVAASPTPRIVRVPDAETFDRMPPMDRFLTCVFDDVCSCVRRDVWERFPFRKTRIAEDLEWAREVLLAGYALAFAADAAVIHSHDRPASYELRRTYLVHQRLCTLFGVRTIPDLPALARSIAWTLPRHFKCATNGSLLHARPREVARALALAIAFPLGQYLGARSADTGREFLRASGV